MATQKLLKVVALLAALLHAGCGIAEPFRDERVVFRDRVLQVLATEFPEETFEATSDPEILKHRDTEFGLQNLRARFNASERTDAELVELVRAHFATSLVAAKVTSIAVAWSEAKTQLRPQFAPAEYLAKMKLAHEPFSGDLLQALVLDSEQTYRYVLEADLERWGVSLEDAVRVAGENLRDASKDISFSGAEGPNRFLAFEIDDGYDAARVLIPDFRKLAAEELGSPFYVAFPNRDFLIMWSKSVSPEFDAHIRQEVAKDFESEPYPLTASVFEATSEGLVELRP